MSARRRAVVVAVCASLLLHAAVWMLLGAPKRIAEPARVPQVLAARFIPAGDAGGASQPAGRRAAAEPKQPVPPVAVPPPMPDATPTSRPPEVQRGQEARTPMPPPVEAPVAPRPPRPATSPALASESPRPSPADTGMADGVRSAPVPPHSDAAPPDSPPRVDGPTPRGTADAAASASAAMAGGDVDASDLDVAPRPLSEVRPEYPAGAGIRSGEVVLDLSIDAAGVVRNAVVVRATLPGWFEASAMEAFLRVRFAPGLRDGQPTAARMRVAVYYSASGISLGGAEAGAGSAR